MSEFDQTPGLGRATQLSRMSGTSPMLVSLAMVLLVFFLALIALSDTDQTRENTAMSSLQDTFLRGNPQAISDFAGVTGDVALPRRSLQESLSALFETEIPAALIQKMGPPRDVTIAEFPAEALFFPDGGALRPARVSFFDGLIAALATAPSGLLFKVEILVATNYDSSKIGEQERSLSLDRAAALAQIMAERGAPPKAFSVGLREGIGQTGYEQGQIVMVFRTLSAEPTTNANPGQ